MSALERLDRSLFELLNSVPHPEWADVTFWFLTSLGLGWVQVIAAVAASLLWWRGRGSFRCSEAARRFLWPCLWSFAVSGLLCQALKRLVERPRPPDLGFKAADEAIFANSFPSGHATTSFAIAVVVWSVTRRTRSAWVGWVALVLALLVGYSRVYRGVHYPFDILAGAVLGAAIGLAVVAYFRRRYQASESSE